MERTSVSSAPPARLADSGNAPTSSPLPVEGGGTKWVLIVNINPGGPAGGSGTQYFAGKFDGKHFVADGAVKDIHWADYGPDFYAARFMERRPELRWASGLDRVDEQLAIRAGRPHFSVAQRHDGAT